MSSQHCYHISVGTNKRGHSSQWLITAAQIKALKYLGITFMVVGAIILIDYISLIRQPPINGPLRAENHKIQSQVKKAKQQLASLETQLGQLEVMTSKISRIMTLAEKKLPFHLSDYELDPRTDSLKPLAFSESSLPLKAGTNPLELVTPYFKQLKHSEHPILPLPGQEKDIDKNLGQRMDQAITRSQNVEHRVLNLLETLSAQKHLIKSTPSLLPARGWFTSRFGYRLDPMTKQPTMHTGLDIAAPPGTNVIAAANGVIRYVGFQRGYGFIVIIDHGYGVHTRYAHNAKVFVEEGDPVKRRQTIAAVGNTGRATGYHLHYEVRVKGVPVDPANYILNID